MIKHEVDVEAINWPNKCAYCSADADSTVRLTSRAVQKFGYWVLFITYTSRVITLFFPVCREHKVKGTLASKLSQRRLFSLFLGVAAVYFMIGAGVDLYRLFNGSEPYEFSWGKIVFFYAFPIAYWWGFIWARVNAPLIIQDLEGKVTLLFKNDDFAQEFIAANGGPAASQPS